MKAYLNSKRLRPMAAVVVVAIGIMMIHPVAAQVTGQPTLPGEPCQTAPREDDKWTPQEQWVWSKVCVGEIADFNTEPGYGGDLDPNKPEDWPKCRVLTPEFLETILLHEPFRSGQHRRGVRIVGAWFKRRIDLTGAEIVRELLLDRSRLDRGATLNNARTRLLSFDGSVVGGQLSMQRAEIRALIMGEGANFQEVNLRGAYIGGYIDMTGSTFAGTLDMDSATVKSSLFMREGANFQEVTLIGAKIGDQLTMRGSTFAGTLTMDSATVGGNLFMREGASFQKVILRGAKIGDQLDMTGSTFAGTLNMNSATVKSSLFMSEGAYFQEVILISAKIGGQLSLINSTFAGTLNMNSATVGGHLFLHGTDLRQALLDGSWLSVGGNFDLRTAKVSKIDLHGATVAGELRLFDDDAKTVWEPGAILDLRYAKAGRLVVSGKSGLGSTRLAGFIYDRLGISAGQSDESASAEDAAEVVQRWLGEEKSHSPQDHEQFALVLRQMGFPDRARQTLYDRKKHELSEEWRRGHLFQSGWLYVQWAMIGYGYRVWHALLWIGALITLGWIVARSSKTKTPRSDERLGFWYSVDRLLPIVELRKSHYEVDLPPPSRVYFYFHTVMGYVLATFLLAALSGLVG